MTGCNRAIWVGVVHRLLSPAFQIQYKCLATLGTCLWYSRGTCHTILAYTTTTFAG